MKKEIICAIRGHIKKEMGDGGYDYCGRCLRQLKNKDGKLKIRTYPNQGIEEKIISIFN